MERIHGAAKYTSAEIESRDEGFIGRELVCEESGMSKTVARVAFWDSDGQFSIETMGKLPLCVLEELIQEAKNLLPS